MNYRTSWFYLIVAGISEVIWAYYMKKSNGLTLIYPSLVFLLFMLISMGSLTLASKRLPISLIYPIWVGIGTVGTVFLGYFSFNEPLSIQKLIFVFIIILGVIGLKLTHKEHIG
ncbi:multidrug efflux SMR transporter [Aeromonas sp. R2-2]|uniref:multidrug efflux SMR transporter n=1 Tax=Aeromonas sp. R2-2 TaxID=3138460 RepID=UPI0034A36DF1